MVNPYYEPFDSGEDENGNTTLINSTNSVWTTTSDITTSTDSVWDTSSNITITNTNNILVLDNSAVTWSDPYTELDELREQIKKEEKLREECPALQEAWDQYQLIKKLVNEEECDKYTEERLKTFRKK